MNWLTPDIHTVTKFYGLSYFLRFPKLLFCDSYLNHIHKSVNN